SGDARRYAHWYYLGASFGRGRSNYPLGGFGNRVDVYLVAGKVVGWVDVAPSTEENQGAHVRRKPCSTSSGRQVESPQNPSHSGLQRRSLMSMILKVARLVH